LNEKDHATITQQNLTKIQNDKLVKDLAKERSNVLNEQSAVTTKENEITDLKKDMRAKDHELVTKDQQREGDRTQVANAMVESLNLQSQMVHQMAGRTIDKDTLQKLFDQYNDVLNAKLSNVLKPQGSSQMKDVDKK